MTTKKQPIANPAEFQDAIDQLARDHIALAEIENELNAEIIALREKKGPAIEALKTRISGSKKSARAYLVKNRKKILPDGKRSTESALAEFGLRKSTSITKLNRDWTPDKSIHACLTSGLADCIVTTRKLNKEALEKQPDETLAAVGLRKTTSENFWLKPKTDTPATI